MYKNVHRHFICGRHFSEFTQSLSKLEWKIYYGIFVRWNNPKQWKNKLLLHLIIWLDLIEMMLSEIIQTPKNTYGMIPFILA